MNRKTTSPLATDKAASRERRPRTTAPADPQAVAWQQRQRELHERDMRRYLRRWHERAQRGDPEALRLLLTEAMATACRTRTKRYPPSVMWLGKRYPLFTTSFGRLIVRCPQTGRALVGSDYFVLP